MLNATKIENGFKYRSGSKDTLERDIKSIKQDEIFAPSREELNDPFEGRFDRKTINSQLSFLGKNFDPHNHIPNVSASFDELLEFVDKCGIFSLSTTPLNELLWAHYGGSHYGFCIEYTIKHLRSFMNPSSEIIEVKYQNTEPILSLSHLFDKESILRAILGTKSNAWSYEDEFRILTSWKGSHLCDFRSIKNIYFGLRCPEETIHLVMKELAGKGIKYRKIISIEESYELSFIDIKDRFLFENTYLTNAAPIADGAITPEFTSDHYIPHNEYLKKAAEIVRRLPYCIEVTDVDFSVNHGTPENPVIYVHCKTKASDYTTTHRFTLKEIDHIYATIAA